MPAGSSQIEFLYRPWAFRVGLWASLATLCGMILMSVRHSGQLENPRRFARIIQLGKTDSGSPATLPNPKGPVPRGGTEKIHPRRLTARFLEPEIIETSQP